MFSRGKQHMESIATEGYEPRGMLGPAGDAKLGRLMIASAPADMESTAGRSLTCCVD